MRRCTQGLIEMNKSEMFWDRMASTYDREEKKRGTDLLEDYPKNQKVSPNE